MIEERVCRKIQYISFGLALSVIYIHTYNVEVYGLPTDFDSAGGALGWLESFFNQVQVACVPFFFMISGYLFFRNYGWDKVWEKYRSRIHSLLVPYLIWCTLYYVLYLILTHIPVIAGHMNMSPVPFSFKYYISCLWNSTYTVLWFIKSLLFAIIGAPLYYGLMKKKSSRLWDRVSLLSSVLLLLYCLLENLQLTGIHFLTAFLNIYFLLGGMLAIRYSTLVERVRKYNVPFGIAGVLAYFFYLGAGGENNVLWVLLFLVSLWNAVDFFSYDVAPKWWMKQTFFIYCGHSFLLEAFEKLWLIVGGKSVWAAAIDYFCIPLVVVGVLAVTAYFFYRYFPRLYKVLSGGRV